MRAGRRDLLLFAGALVVRSAHLAVIRPGPVFRYLFIDSEYYDAVGRRLAEGGAFPDGVFFMNVLYGVFLGAVYGVCGVGEGGRLAVLALQAVLGAGSVVMTARLGAVLGRPRDGLLAAVVLALYGPAIFYDGALLTPSLLLFLTTGAVLVAARAARGGSGMALGLGAVTGLLVLGRANHLLLVPGWAWLLLRRGRRGVVPVAVFLVTVIVVVSPVTIRNLLVSGEFVPVTANGGMALWAGNHEGATGIYSQPAFLSNPVPDREAEEYRTEASRRAGRELTLAGSSRFWVGETLRRWRSDPGRSARLLLRKLRLFFHATEAQTNLSYYLALDASPVLAVCRIHLGWILPFAFLGMARELRRLALPALPVAVSLVTCLLFYVSSEYRHPVVPCLLLFAAAGVRHAFEVVRWSPSLPRRVAIAGVLLGALVLVNYRDPFLARLQSRRVDYLNFGTLAATAGELEEAEAFLRRSIAIDPYWPNSRRKLAEVLNRMGRVREAGEEGRRAELLAGAPSDASAVLLEKADRLFREGKFAQAREVFLELAGGGGDPVAPALNNAGLCSMNLGEVARAESLFLAAVEEDPGYASPRIHLGRLALALGDSAAAAGRAAEALEIAPEDGRARRLLVRARGKVPAE